MYLASNTSHDIKTTKGVGMNKFNAMDYRNPPKVHRVNQDLHYSDEIG